MCCHDGDLIDGIRIIAVHVENRRLDQLRDVGRMPRGTPFLRQRREADLIVDDDMDRAAEIVGRQPRKLEHFGHEPLPCEARIRVQQERQHGALPFRYTARPLLGSRPALADNRHEL